MGRMARVFFWSGGVLALAGTVALCALSVVVGLTKANELAGVVSAVAALAGLGVSVYGLVMARRDSSRSTGPPGKQSVIGSTTVGGIAQVQGVAGGVTTRAASRPAVAPSAAVLPVLENTPPVAASESAPSATQGRGQSVTDSQIGGNVTQISGVGGDVDVSP